MLKRKHLAIPPEDQVQSVPEGADADEMVTLSEYAEELEAAAPDEDAPTFWDAALDALAGAASQASIAIERLRHRAHESEYKRVHRDLEIARHIQRSFLPDLPSVVGGYRFVAEYRPAFDVGGDFYDVVASGPGQITAVIGDVSGHGVAGALVMSRISHEVRRLARTATSPHRLLDELNESFPIRLDNIFVTVACVMLDAPRRRISVANAGHVLPLVRRCEGTVVSLGAAAGPPIGVFSTQTYCDETFPLELGDIVLLMTDGITEALHTDRDLLGRWALRDAIAHAPSDGGEIGKRILDEVDHRIGPSRPRDDVTLLSLEVTEDALEGSAAQDLKRSRSAGR